MRVINVRNVHQALPEAIYLLFSEGIIRDSRNGPVWYVPGGVTTVYERPRERVLFWPQREANPFFHFYEALWMLGGCCDVARLTRFVKSMGRFSDDGVTFHGAYGNRWRHHFGGDQLLLIAQALRKNPNCRRQVLQMWDTWVDLSCQADKRDVPCNLMATFQVSDLGALDMTVFNRSNDIIWGCYGANAVHFSMLQEVMSALVGVPVGTFTHISVNWHGYIATVDPLADLATEIHRPRFHGDEPDNPYQGMLTFPVVNGDPQIWFQDLKMFLEEETLATGYRDVFFRRVALPMMRAHDAYKKEDRPLNFIHALQHCEQIKAHDWRVACIEWIKRREAKWGAKSKP